MEKVNVRFILAFVVLFSLTTAATLKAAPVKYNQVVQVINAKPGKAGNSGFAQLRLSGEIVSFSNTDNDNDEDKKKKKETAEPLPQDNRVITETSVEIVEEEYCDCEDIVVPKGGFPYWTLGFAALPLLFLIPRKKRTPTPTPPESPTPTPTPTTPTPTPTPTPPGMTPTPTPPESPTPTPTPTMTPTPTPPMMTPTPPEPVPEPITILLFGSGLAGVGLAARKKFGRRRESEEGEEE